MFPRLCLLLFALFFSLISPVWALESGFLLHQRQTLRYGLDQGNLEGQILLAKQSWNLMDTLEDWTWEVTATHLDYRMQNAAGQNAIQLQTQVLLPKLRYQKEGVDVLLGLNHQAVSDSLGSFTRFAGDTQQQWNMPIFEVAYPLGEDWRLLASLSEEVEAQLLSGSQYGLFHYRWERLGAEWRWQKNWALQGKLGLVVRDSPATFAMEKQEVILNLLVDEPEAGVDFAKLKRANLELSQVWVKGTPHNTLKGEVLLLGDWWGVSHFVTGRLSLMDSVTTFEQAFWDLSLIEAYHDRADLELGLEYAGFTRLGESPWFVGWGAQLKQSLIQKIQSDLWAEAKLSYLF